jgi:Na+/proline symporter
MKLITTSLALLLRAWSALADSPGNCIADENINTQFAQLLTGTNEYTIPDDSCCQREICLLGCPEEVPDPSTGFGVVVMVAIAFFVIIGFSTLYFVKSKSENYFVAGRSLPLWVITATLASQSLDSNAILGNVDLSYKYHFYDGAVLPIGLGLSLVLNGIFLARHINGDGALTLPDVFSRRYGKLVELLVSLCTIISFLCLLAGNLVGMGAIVSYVIQVSQEAAIWISAVLVLLYTIAGGLFSVAYTDVVQAAVGWVGCSTLAFYMIANAENSAPPPSIGYPLYSYPDQETCDMYDGVPCTNLEGTCCYNEAKWCPNGPDSDDCILDNGAYPIGDLPVIPEAMTNPLGLTPFPNAIIWNLATIFILGFGNLAALDFQARCMASKTPKIATIGCLIAGCLTFLVGIPFAYLGAITRTHYGPDTPRAEFATDTCSDILGLPTCGMWMPDPQAFIKLLTHEAPAFLGAWCLVGIVAASMVSTVILIGLEQKTFFVVAVDLSS